MDIKGFVYELARRGDSEELRELGTRLMIAVWGAGDPSLVLGFLVNDWMKMVEQSGMKLDGQVDALLGSRRAEGTVQ